MTIARFNLQVGAARTPVPSPQGRETTETCGEVRSGRSQTLHGYSYMVVIPTLVERCMQQPFDGICSRRSGEGRNPRRKRIPAFAGMTGNTRSLYTELVLLPKGDTRRNLAAWRGQMEACSDSGPNVQGLGLTRP